jgi:hypothetical protein
VLPASCVGAAGWGGGGGGGAARPRPAPPEPAGSADEGPPISLSLSMVSVAGTDSAALGEERHATLECLPAGGTHPAPAESCRILIQVGGDVEALPLNPGPCPRIWDPVVVTVEGRWFDDRVDFAAQYGNAECAAAASDGVFDF